MKITLNQIRNNYRQEKPCEESWLKLLKALGKTKADDTVITAGYLLETLDVSDTLWVIDNCIENKSKVRLMCADFAERVLPIWENWAKDNAKEHLTAPRKVIELIRSGARQEDLAAAGDAAGDAARAAAGDAAGDAAWAAAWAAAGDAARAAAWAAARAAAGDAARAAERKAQERIILKHFG